MIRGRRSGGVRAAGDSSASVDHKIGAVGQHEIALSRLERIEDDRPGGLPAAAGAFEPAAEGFERAPSAALDHLHGGERVRRRAVAALDAQAAAETDEIGGRAHVLGGPSAGVGTAEQKGNMAKIAERR